MNDKWLPPGHAARKEMNTAHEALTQAIESANKPWPWEGWLIAGYFAWLLALLLPWLWIGAPVVSQ